MSAFASAPEQRIGNKNVINRRLRNAPFKIKRLLPQAKQVKVKKIGKVLRRINAK